VAAKQQPASSVMYSRRVSRRRAAEFYFGARAVQVLYGRESCQQCLAFAELRRLAHYLRAGTRAYTLTWPTSPNTRQTRAGRERVRAVGRHWYSRYPRHVPSGPERYRYTSVHRYNPTGFVGACLGSSEASEKRTDPSNGPRPEWARFRRNTEPGGKRLVGLAGRGLIGARFALSTFALFRCW
jgi:hypothetical protein